MGKRRGPDGNEGAVRSGLQEGELDHRHGTEGALVSRQKEFRLDIRGNLSPDRPSKILSAESSYGNVRKSYIH